MAREISPHLPPPDIPCPCGQANVAHRLANGMQILALAPTRRADYFAVLALDARDLVNPFATFIADPVAGAFRGHYFAALAEALADLTARTGE